MIRRTLLVLLLAVVACAAIGGTAGAHPKGQSGPTLPEGVYGPYTFKAGHDTVTVGYHPCTYTQVVDGQTETMTPAYYAQITHKNRPLFDEAWGHTADDLSNGLLGAYGYGLTSEAFAVLATDTQTYFCTG